MKKAFLVFSCLALLAPMFLIAATSSAPYDAWSDLDADGDIDIFDVVKIAGAYGTTGDPGKNVNVTNWPTTVPVFVRGYATVSGAYSSDVDPNGLYGVTISTTGYRTISIGIEAYTVIADTPKVTVFWEIGDPLVPYQFEEFTHPGGSNRLLKVYDVRGSMLHISFHNLDLVNSITVFVDYYMTA